MNAGRAPADQEAALERTLAEAERKGLRLAIKARLIALGLLALWFAVSRSADPLRALEFVAAIAHTTAHTSAT